MKKLPLIAYHYCGPSFMGAPLDKARVSSFLTELEQIAFRLKSLNIAIDDEKIMAKVLMSLPAEFRVFGFAWESTPVDEKTLKRLTTRLITLDKSMRNDKEKRSTPDAVFFSKNKNGAESHDEE